MPLERTQIGLQHVIPGAERDPAALAKKLASEPLKPGKAQLPCDVGLFGDQHKQEELF